MRLQSCTFEIAAPCWPLALLGHMQAATGLPPAAAARGGAETARCSAKVQALLADLHALWGDVAGGGGGGGGGDGGINSGSSSGSGTAGCCEPDAKVVVFSSHRNAVRHLDFLRALHP